MKRLLVFGFVVFAALAVASNVHAAPSGPGGGGSGCNSSGCGK